MDGEEYFVGGGKDGEGDAVMTCVLALLLKGRKVQFIFLLFGPDVVNFETSRKEI